MAKYGISVFAPMRRLRLVGVTGIITLLIGSVFAVLGSYECYATLCATGAPRSGAVRCAFTVTPDTNIGAIVMAAGATLPRLSLAID